MADRIDASRQRPAVRAAGAVVWRRGQEVLLVHRPRYDDWSFPKGKLDRGEHPTTAAVREVAEETGLHVRLTAPLDQQRYELTGGRAKTVDYWVGRCVGSDDVSDYLPNDEIDLVRWLPVDKALNKLTYTYDRDTLRQAIRRHRKTQAFVVLRHGSARARRTWRRPDADRPLLRTGTEQAHKLVGPLAAFDVTTIASSSSRRCVDTVDPYAAMTGFDLDRYDELSEEGASEEAVAQIVESLLESTESVVLCTHRPVLSLVWKALGEKARTLQPGEFVVFHHRKGRIRAIEVHRI